MEAWKMFWTVSLLVAGAAFALITLVVLFKGGRDLRAMLTSLKQHRHDERTH
jgi:hypothetical protein